MADYESVPILRDNPNDEFVFLVEWLVADGARVEKDQGIATVETSKATVEIPAPSAGVIRYIHKKGVRISIGENLAFICKDKSVTPPFDSMTRSEPAENSSSTEIRITQKAKKLMTEHRLEATDFPGLQEIKEEDVRKKIQNGSSPKSSSVPANRTEIAPNKLFEISRLKKVYNEVLYSKVEKAIDRSAVEQKMRMLNPKSESVTLGEMVVYAVARVLKILPEFNSYFSDNSLFQYQEINIGYAININQGLKVPVVHRADQKSFSEISHSIKDYSMNYLRGELTPEDLSKGTFTVTDLHGYGILSFDPVLNVDQAAILGIASGLPESKYFNLILAFDHRVTDGMRAAEFLKKLDAELTGTTK